MGKIFGTAFVLTLIGAVLLAGMMPDGAGIGGGLTLGAIIGIGFIATSMGTNSLFARQPLNLWLIDASYMAVVYLVMGAIIGVWQ